MPFGKPVSRQRNIIEFDLYGNVAAGLIHMLLALGMGMGMGSESVYGRTFTEEGQDFGSAPFGKKSLFRSFP
jgi:hypothetical protein